MIRRVTIEGYAGFSAGQMFAGALGGTLLMRLSGQLAKENWCKAYECSSNVSRLDLQATVRYTPEVKTVAERVERDVLRKLDKSRSPLDVGIVRSRRKGSTCVIGRRVSERYARIYDKRRESGDAEYDRCWRWEVEYKRKKAQAVASQLYDESERDSLISGVLLDTFKGYGCMRVWPGSLRTVYGLSVRPESNASRMLTWLCTGVRPTLDKLRAQGREAEALTALGLERYLPTQIDEEGDNRK